MFGRKAAEIVRLQYRVAELEERLCPCESHEWKQIGFHTESCSASGFDIDVINHYKCARCGKTKEVRE